MKNIAWVARVFPHVSPLRLAFEIWAIPVVSFLVLFPFLGVGEARGPVFERISSVRRLDNSVALQFLLV